MGRYGPVYSDKAACLFGFLSFDFLFSTPAPPSTSKEKGRQPGGAGRTINQLQWWKSCWNHQHESFTYMSFTGSTDRKPSSSLPSIWIRNRRSQRLATWKGMWHLGAGFHFSNKQASTHTHPQMCECLIFRSSSLAGGNEPFWQISIYRVISPSKAKMLTSFVNNLWMGMWSFF